MNPTLKGSLIVSLSVIVGLQINYIVESQLKLTGFIQRATSFVIILFTILFLVSLTFVYRLIKLNQERKRYRSHSIISNRDYEKMTKDVTQRELDKLVASEAYKKWTHQRSTKKMESGSKTTNSLAESEDEFERDLQEKEHLFFDE